MVREIYSVAFKDIYERELTHGSSDILHTDVKAA